MPCDGCVVRLSADMVLGAMQGYRDSGQRFVLTSEIRQAVQAAHPEVVIHKGAINARLRRLEGLGKVNAIIDPRRGADTLWELLEGFNPDGTKADN